MAKRVIWSLRAREERKEILEYWAKRNGNKIYSRKLAKQFRDKVEYMSRYNYIGTATDIENVRASVCGNYILFYEVDEEYIKILAIWDGRRNPDDLNLITPG
jgi:toxin YoeB